MSQAVLSSKLTKKVQWEVSQIADKRFPCVMCKLKPPKKADTEPKSICAICGQIFKSVSVSYFHLNLHKNAMQRSIRTYRFHVLTYTVSRPLQLRIEHNAITVDPTVTATQHYVASSPISGLANVLDIKETVTIANESHQTNIS